MRYVSVLAATVVCFTAGSANASLISLGADSLSGQGLGSQDTSLTFTSAGNATTESGCVAAGVGGTTVTGAAACPGNGPNGLTAFTGGDEQAATDVHAATDLGLTDFNDLRILFNASEPDNDITITNLSLTLWDPVTGQILDAYYITAPVLFANTNPGVGNAGFFFGLDGPQAIQANLILAANPNLFLGLAANASDATGGLETFSFGVSQDGLPSVPEPMTLTLLGFGLAGLGWLTRKRSV